MKYLLIALSLLFYMESAIVFDFNEQTDIAEWRIVNDVVMGGNSSSTITLNDEGLGVFAGRVSLENNGGFSSVRHACEVARKGKSKIVLRLRGDGKSYQFRIKANALDRHSYIASFQSSGDWEEIEIALIEFYPSFRGRRLELGNFSADKFEEIAFLIGNKKAETFKLELDWIALR